MDDPRTREMLDALADLYLTDALPPQPGAPVGRAAGARPVRLPPKAAGPAPARQNPAPVSDATQPPIAAGRDLVETVFLGNLPGFGGPWLTQYAAMLARSVGPVVVLRVDDENVDVELVRAAEVQSAVPRLGDSEESAASDRDLMHLLHELARSGPSAARRFLVHVSGDVSRVHELPGAWTLLCGADETAVVGGYRLLKQFHEGRAAASAQRWEGARRVGVAIMGSEASRAAEAAARIRSAAGSFLQQPVELVGSLAQMAPVSARWLGSFADEGDLWAQVRGFLVELSLDQAGEEEPAASTAEAGDSQEPAAAAEQASVTAAEEQALASRPQDEPEVYAFPGAAADDSLEEEGGEEELEAARVRPQRQPPRSRLRGQTPPPSMPAEPVEENADEAMQEDTRLEPEGQPAGAPVAAESLVLDGEPDLAQFLAGEDVAGAMALEARCPRQRGTQLVVDAAGRLHLLRRHRSAAGEDLRAALADLLDAQAWAREHVELLQLTSRETRLDAAAVPELHLFTDRAKEAAALVGRMGTVMKVHLLQAIRAGGAMTWFSTALN